MDKELLLVYDEPAIYLAAFNPGNNTGEIIVNDELIKKCRRPLLLQDFIIRGEEDPNTHRKITIVTASFLAAEEYTRGHFAATTGISIVPGYILLEVGAATLGESFRQRSGQPDRTVGFAGLLGSARLSHGVSPGQRIDIAATVRKEFPYQNQGDVVMKVGEKTIAEFYGLIAEVTSISDANNSIPKGIILEATAQTIYLAGRNRLGAAGGFIPILQSLGACIFPELVHCGDVLQIRPEMSNNQQLKQGLVANAEVVLGGARRVGIVNYRGIVVQPSTAKRMLR